MPNHVLLNNVDHRDLRIITERSAKYGDNVNFSVTFPGEFRHLQAYYPIVFSKAVDTGQFQPLALFGFEEDENLFLVESGWDATYIPLTIERQPFLIGFRGPGPDREMVIHVDMDSPRISREEGEPVFLEHGGITDYLDRVNAMLSAIHGGMESNQPFVEALLENDLLESFTLDIELNDGSEHRLAGFYTINEDKLDELGGDALETLNAQGFLKAIYMVLASMSNFRLLIERKNALRDGTPA